MSRNELNFWHETRHIVMLAFVILILIFVSTTALQSSFRYFLIDLQSVKVANHKVGEDAELVAYRVIHNDFYGSFRVTVRNAKDHSYVCQPPSPKPFTYRAEASKKQPLVMTLGKWLGSAGAIKACMEEDAPNRFGAGLYYLNTCHEWLLLGIVPFKRCVESNVFERT